MIERLGLRGLVKPWQRRTVATIVADPAHIVTADGSHWFPGATLPTGHHLVSVTPNAVTFEKDGRMERITP